MKTLLIITIAIMFPLFISSQTLCNEYSLDDIAIIDLNCDESNIEFCTPILLFENSNYEIYNNGSQILNANVCGSDSIYTYYLGGIIGSPFKLDRWEVNGDLLSGNFDDINSLVNLMNKLNPSGNWSEINLNVISNPNNGNSYGDMIIKSLSTGAINQISANMIVKQRYGFELLTSSDYNLEVKNLDRNCSDLINIQTECYITSTNNEITIEEHFKCNVFPNPSNIDKLIIEYSLAKSSVIEIKLYNAQGGLEKILSNKRKYEKGNYIIELNENFQTGIYFLQFDSKEEVHYKKIIKI